jgi:hypothetical protein
VDFLLFSMPCGFASGSDSAISCRRFCPALLKGFVLPFPVGSSDYSVVVAFGEGEVRPVWRFFWLVAAATPTNLTEHLNIPLSTYRNCMAVLFCFLCIDNANPAKRVSVVRYSAFDLLSADRACDCVGFLF